MAKSKLAKWKIDMEKKSLEEVRKARKIKTQIRGWTKMHKPGRGLVKVLCPDTAECYLYEVSVDKRGHDKKGLIVYACPHCGFHVFNEGCDGPVTNDGLYGWVL